MFVTTNCLTMDYLNQRHNINDKTNINYLKELYNNSYNNIVNFKPKNKNGYYLLFWNDKKYYNLYSRDGVYIRKTIACALNIDFKDLIFFVSNERIQVGFKDYNLENIKKILGILTNFYKEYINIKPENNNSNIKSKLNLLKLKRIDMKKEYKIEITDNIFDALCDYDSEYINIYGYNVCKIKINYSDDFIINRNEIKHDINNKLKININIYVKRMENKVEINFTKKESKKLGLILEMIEEWDNSFYYFHPPTLSYVFEKKIIIKKKKEKKEIQKNIIIESKDIESINKEDKEIIISIIDNERVINDNIENNENNEESDIDEHIEFSSGFGAKGTRKQKNENYMRGVNNRHSVSNESKKKHNHLDDYIEKYIEVKKKIIKIDEETDMRNNIGVIKKYLGNGRVRILICNIEYSHNIEEVTATICGNLRRFSKDHLKLGDFVSVVNMFNDKYFIEAKLSKEIIKYNIDNGTFRIHTINALIKKLNNNDINLIEETDDDHIVFRDDEFDEFIDMEDMEDIEENDISYKLFKTVDTKISTNNFIKSNNIKKKGKSFRNF